MKINKYWIVNRLPVSKAVKLRWSEHLLRAQYKAEKEVARKTKTLEELESFEHDWMFEFHMHTDEEREYYSRKLMQRARHLRVIVPAYYEGSKLTEDYEESSITGLINLSLQGENKVRAAIREEEKHRSEKWARRIPYISAIAGLFGVLTGLLAIIDKLRQ